MAKSLEVERGILALVVEVFRHRHCDLPSPSLAEKDA